MMKDKAPAFFSLLLTALVTGVFWGTWFTLTRSLDQFSPGEFVHIGKTIIAHVAWPMRVMMPLTLLFLFLTAWLHRHRRPAFYFFAFSFLLMAVALIITVAVEVPIDNQIKTWTENRLPANWKQLRQKWNDFHTIRTLVSIASFAALSAGILYRFPFRKLS